MNIPRILITVSDTTVSRNLLDTSLLSDLAGRGAELVLVCPERREVHYKERYESHGLSVVSLPEMPLGIVERVFSFIARNAFRSDTLYLMQWRAYLSGESSIHPYAKRLLAFLFGWRIFRALVRALECMRRSDEHVRTLFDTSRPTLVLSTMLLDANIDVRVMREATRRGILTAGMVRSWDNLTTYGFLRILPNRFIAQNNFIRDMASHRHDMPLKRITVVGLPHYDAYVTPSVVKTRKQFCEELELDPLQPIWLYGGVGDFLFPAEASLASILDDIAGQQDAQVLFRAHPAHASEAVFFDNLKHMRFDRTADYLSDGFNEWEMRAEHEAHFINTLYHSDILITASGTSMLVDGAVFNKPLVSVAFDGTKEMPYWFSIQRFFDYADHSKVLLTQGGTRVVYSQEELAKALLEYAKNPMLLDDGRRRIVKLLASPLGGASTRLADVLMSMSDRK